MYDAYGKPLGPSEYPHPGYPMAPQYPGMPPQYPMMQPGPYAPHMMDPAYSQGRSHSRTRLTPERSIGTGQRKPVDLRTFLHDLLEVKVHF